MKLKYYLIDYSIGAKGERKQSNMSCSTDSRYRPHEKFLLEQSIVSNVSKESIKIFSCIECPLDLDIKPIPDEDILKD